MAKISINVMEKIQEAIRTRYSKSSIIKNAFDNDVVSNLGKPNYKLLKRFDTYFNQNLLILNPSLTNTFPVTYNGNKSQTLFFNEVVKQYCTDVVGYDPTTPDGKIKTRALLDSIAQKHLKLAIIGYGGAMINFLWNTYLLAYITSYNDPIFKEITIFEKENISLTNILRISKPIILDSFLNIHCGENGVLPKIRLFKEEFQLAEKTILFKRYLEDEEEIRKMTEDNYIFLGAPNFEARVLLQESKFFFLGHANNELEIFYQPLVDMELTFESYGSIDIPVLLSNLAVGTIKMLEIFNEIKMDKKTPVIEYTQSQSLFKVDYGEVYGLVPEVVSNETSPGSNSSDW